MRLILIGISGFPAAMPEQDHDEIKVLKQLQIFTDSRHCVMCEKVHTCPESFLDGVNSLIGEAGALKVGPDLDGLLCQLSLDVLNQHGLGVLIKVQRVEQAAMKDFNTSKHRGGLRFIQDPFITSTSESAM